MSVICKKFVTKHFDAAGKVSCNIQISAAETAIGVMVNCRLSLSQMRSPPNAAQRMLGNKQSKGRVRMEQNIEHYRIKNIYLVRP